MTLEELPDYPILKQLSKSLWKTGNTQGAAIMVGAGFSCNAELLSPTAKNPPLWRDFEYAMKDELPEMESSDPLAIAEAYEALFGRPELDGLIRKMVPDEQWEPGDLHRRLLDLPWNDALTTNWDTLLERARQGMYSQRYYDVVNVQEDIARTRSPRIVKLHGSLPSHTPFIFTTKDYENYPKKSSAFINLVRQVLLENDLCLIGFSGDDPNFIGWVKWVQQELGPSARRIFLIGNLNLSKKERGKFKKNNIIPVDLAPLFTKNQAVSDPYFESSKVFLEFLERSKPKPSYEWPDEALYKELQINPVTQDDRGHPTSRSCEAFRDPAISVSLIREKLPLFQKLHASYPAWIVCPTEIRRKIINLTRDTFSGFDKSIELLSRKEAGQVLYEVAWAHDISYRPIDTCTKELMTKAIEGELSNDLTLDQRRYIVITLLKSSRESDDPEASFVKWSDWLEANGDDESRALASLERCLRARDRLDYGTLQKEVNNLQGHDPIWKVRRAGFFAELGDIDESSKLIREATFELTGRQAKDRTSIWIISRLAWAAMLSRTLRWNNNDESENAKKSVYETSNWSSEFKEFRSDPFDLMENLENKIDENLLKLQQNKKPISAKFDPGRFDNDANTIRFVGPDHHSEVYQLHRMLDEMAIPISLGMVGITNTRIQKTLFFSAWDTLGGCLKNIRILFAAKDKDWDEHLSRTNIALIDEKLIPEIVGHLENVILFFEASLKKDRTKRNVSLSSHLKAALEFLSRFACRMSLKKAEATFEQACKYIANDTFQDWRLFDSLENLVTRSLSAMPQLARNKHAITLISLPFAIENGYENHLRWPEPINHETFKNANRDFTDQIWIKRIYEIIQLIDSESNSPNTRNSAILRLFYLMQVGLLSEDEKQQFVTAIWKNKGSTDLFPKSNLYPHAYLDLPSSEDQNIQQLLNRYCDFSSDKRPMPEQLYVIRGAATNKKKPHLPSLEKAKSMLNFLLALSPLTQSERDRDLYNSDSELFLSMSGTLANAILPVFSPESWPPEFTTKLLDWLDNESSPSAIEVLPELVRLDPTTSAASQTKIRRGLVKQNKHAVQASLHAIGQWIETDAADFPPLPYSFVRGVIGNVGSLRYPLLHQAIYTAQLLVKKSLVEAEEIEILLCALEDLETYTAYSTWNQDHEETCSLSFVRMNSIRLAKELIEHGYGNEQCQRWLGIAASDPLPEVRHVLEDTDYD